MLQNSLKTKVIWLTENMPHCYLYNGKKLKKKTKNHPSEEIGYFSSKQCKENFENSENLAV